MPRHLLIALLLALGAGSAAAQNLRCGNTFADRGDSKMSVLSKCGEPVLRDRDCRPDPQPNPDGTARPCLNVDVWSYRPGRGQFVTMLEFEQDKLTTIRYGDRIP